VGSAAAVDAAIAQVGDVLADPAEAVRTESLGFGEDERARRRFGHGPAGAGTHEGSARPSPRLVERQRRHQRKASSTLSAIMKDTRRFGLGRHAGDVRREQQVRGSRKGVRAGERLGGEDVERSAAEVAAAQRRATAAARRRCRRARC
jgi:hypothetical protein